MDFWRTLGVLLRRWYVALPTLVVSFGLAGGVYLSVHTDYESTGTIVLTSPTDGASVSVGEDTQHDRVNPLLAFDGSLITSAQIIIQKLQDPAISAELEDAANLSKYEVGNGQLSGPFIVVVATARSPESAQSIVTRVLDRARAELTSSQEALKAPQSTFITPVQVIAPTPAEAKTGGKVRFAAAALVLGFVASLSSAYAVESIMDGRRRRDDKGSWHLSGSLEIPADNGRHASNGAAATNRIRPLASGALPSGPSSDPNAGGR